METVEIVRVENDPGLLEQALLIRRRVFIEEQGVPAALEFDASDADAVHLLARLGQRPVGTLRVRFPEPGIAKLERVAVMPEARGLEVGGCLILRAFDLAASRGAGEARLHAQVQARRFYERLGFGAFGETFTEDGILHIAMRRRLGSDEEGHAT